MTGLGETQWLALIALIGWLILVASGFRSYKVGWSRGLVMAGFWAGIFAVVLLFIQIVS